MAEHVVIERAGSWDQLRFQEFTSPETQDDQIRIDVEAIGINFADIAVRQGLYASARQLVGWPITPGFEVAGTVAEAGKDVTGLQVGERVMAATFFNGYSSEVTVQAPYARPIPEDMSFSEAASIPAVFMTSYYATQHLARTHPGSTALIHSAAGGVGLAMTQTLKEQDCRVVGVVGSPEKRDVAYEYGADAVVSKADKSSRELWRDLERLAPNGYDQIFDPNGIGTLKQSYEHLAVGGLLFVYGFQSMLSKDKGRQNPLTLLTRLARMPHFNPREMVQTNRSVMGFNISFLFDKTNVFDKGFDYIIENFENGTFEPLPITTYPFKEVAQAHKDIESGKTTGKLVLTVNDR